MIETVCESYSEHYAIYSREALINLLCELYPTYQGNAVDILVAIRKELKQTYNIV